MSDPHLAARFIRFVDRAARFWEAWQKWAKLDADEAEIAERFSPTGEICGFVFLTVPVALSAERRESYRTNRDSKCKKLYQRLADLNRELNVPTKEALSGLKSLTLIAAGKKKAALVHAVLEQNIVAPCELVVDQYLAKRLLASDIYSAMADESGTAQVGGRDSTSGSAYRRKRKP
jgi:hypothetical protein